MNLKFFQESGKKKLLFKNYFSKILKKGQGYEECDDSSHSLYPPKISSFLNFF